MEERVTDYKRRERPKGYIQLVQPTTHPQLLRVWPPDPLPSLNFGYSLSLFTTRITGLEGEIGLRIHFEPV